MARILIVDDEDKFLSMLRRRLERDGHEVLEALDGKGGLKLVRENAIDLIITDLIMPDKEGIEMIMELKKDYPEVPIIAVSGGGQGDPNTYLMVAKDLGAKYTFPKPLDWEPFIETVKDLTN